MVLQDKFKQNNPLEESEVGRMNGIKYLANVNGQDQEIKPCSLESDLENKTNGERVTFKEMCELIAKWFKETRGIEVTGKQVFNSSPSGELWHIFAWYAEAKSILTGNKNRIQSG